MTTVYFAGPDIFRPDYEEHSARLRDLCARTGLTALLPGDGHYRESRDIFQHNLDLINRADGLIANLNPFRSPVEPDSGTVFECAYAFARGKFVIGVLGDRRPLLSRLPNRSPEAGPICPGGWRIEDFGLPLNLMLCHCLNATAADFPEAVALAAGGPLPAGPGSIR